MCWKGEERGEKGKKSERVGEERWGNTVVGRKRGGRSRVGTSGLVFDIGGILVLFKKTL